MRRLLGLAMVAAGVVLVLPGSARASVVAAWSPQTGAGAYGFGTVEIGHPASQVFQLANSGTTATPVLRIRLSGSATFRKSHDGCSGHRVAAGGSCSVRVTYTPTTDGATDASTLIARKQSGGHRFATLQLSGTAHGTADLEWAVASYDFGTTAGTFQATLTNVGTATATQAAGANSYVPGTLQPDIFCAGSAVTLAPGASCTATWTFAPSQCDSNVHGSISGFDDIESYWVDSSFTTTAGPAKFTVSATCP